MPQGLAQLKAREDKNFIKDNYKEAAAAKVARPVEVQDSKPKNYGKVPQYIQKYN